MRTNKVQLKLSELERRRESPHNSLIQRQSILKRQSGVARKRRRR
jgi:hypothetical protein